MSAFPYPLPFFFFGVSPTIERLCLEVFQPQNKSKWHVTRTQCLDGPASVSIPICRGWFLFCGLSATSGVCVLGGAGWGSGTGSSAETKASASQSGWHGREVTARKPPLPTAAHWLPAFAQVQVIHHPSGFRCLVTCPWRTRIQHRTKVSACNERFDSWRVTEAEVMELLQIWSWLMLMGQFEDGGHN